MANLGGRNRIWSRYNLLSELTVIFWLLHSRMLRHVGRFGLGFGVQMSEPLSFAISGQTALSAYLVIHYCD